MSASSNVGDAHTLSPDTASNPTLHAVPNPNITAAPTAPLPNQQPSKMEARVEALAESVSAAKKEIDALQIAFESKQRPWYRDVSSLVALLALLFSFGTTYVSLQRSKAQDIQSMRQDLRSILERLAALPKEFYELPTRYSDLGSRVAASSLINQENAILSRQAAEIVRKLPPGSVSATEYYAVAVALQNSYNYNGEREFLDLSLANANDFNDKIAALRQSANLMFIQGRLGDGRAQYQKAVDIFSDEKYGSYDPLTKALTREYTEVAWAVSEAQMGDRSFVGQHLDSAEAALAGLPHGPATDSARMQVQQARTSFQNASEPAPSGQATPQLPVPAASH